MSASQGTKSVGIVGLGYVGSSLAMAFTEAGYDVVGVEMDCEKVALLNSGDSYVEDVDAGRLQHSISSGKLKATDGFTVLAEVDAVIICLPTPLNEHREPDLSILVSGAREVARNLREKTLVVLESTTYPGTTREVLLPIFEGNKDDTIPHVARRVGRDFHLAFSPELVNPVNKRYSTELTPQEVRGADCVVIVTDHSTVEIESTLDDASTTALVD